MNRRLFPQHFNFLGKPKRPFYSQEEAEWEAWDKDMKSYKCDFCNNWHLAKKERDGESV